MDHQPLILETVGITVFSSLRATFCFWILEIRDRNRTSHGNNNNFSEVFATNVPSLAIRAIQPKVLQEMSHRQMFPSLPLR